MDFEQALYHELLTIPGLSVHPITAPANTDPPYLVYTPASKEREQILDLNFDGSETSHIEIALYHKKYELLNDKYKLVVNKLKSFQGRVIGTNGPLIQSISFITEYKDYEDQAKLYHGFIEFACFYEET